MAADTRTRILDAAERLFAENGIAATSLRHVIRESRVNIAAIHYHFRSRGNLIRAVLARRLGPVNAVRLERLDRCEAAAGRGAPPLEEVLAALLEPVFQLRGDPRKGGVTFVRFFGRIFTESGACLPGLVREQMGEVLARFTAALRRALPGLTGDALYHRLHFLVGAMVFTVLNLGRLPMLPGGGPAPPDMRKAFAHIMDFLVAGLRAPCRGGRAGLRAPGGSRAMQGGER
jgi:AcrR family transcriptional regulator